MRVLITGGAGFIGSHLCDLFLAEGCEVICMDNLLTGREENIAAALGESQVPLRPLRRDRVPRRRRGPRLHPAFRQPGKSGGLREAGDPHPQGRRPRDPQDPRPGAGKGSEVPAGFDLRGLRRPARPSPERGVPGQRELHRHPRRLRRGQALRRVDGDGLQPHPRHRRAHCQDLQHLRRAHAQERRPRRSQLHNTVTGRG